MTPSLPILMLLQCCTACEKSSSKQGIAKQHSLTPHTNYMHYILHAQLKVNGLPKISSFYVIHRIYETTAMHVCTDGRHKILSCPMVTLTCRVRGWMWLR